LITSPGGLRSALSTVQDTKELAKSDGQSTFTIPAEGFNYTALE